MIKIHVQTEGQQVVLKYLLAINPRWVDAEIILDKLLYTEGADAIDRKDFIWPNYTMNKQKSDMLIEAYNKVSEEKITAISELRKVIIDLRRAIKTQPQLPFHRDKSGPERGYGPQPPSSNPLVRALKHQQKAFDYLAELDVVEFLPPTMIKIQKKIFPAYESKRSYKIKSKVMQAYVKNRILFKQLGIKTWKNGPGTWKVYVKTAKADFSS